MGKMHLLLAVASAIIAATVEPGEALEQEQQQPGDELRRFYPSQGETPDTQRVWEFHLDSYEVPAEETTYIDVAWNFPLREDERAHIVGFEPLVDRFCVWVRDDIE